MKDTDLRGVLLNQLYEMRRSGNYMPKVSDFGIDFPQSDIVRIAQQLEEHDLVKANFLRVMGNRDPIMTQCRISAHGIDTVESGASPNLRINLTPQQNITITGSSNVIVGNNNQQTITHSIQELARVIDSSTATPEQKEEAKGLLKKFLEHPLLAATAGAAIGLLG